MSVGGIIVAVKQRKDSTELLVKDGKIYSKVKAAKNDFKINDKIWWQSGIHYWTRPINEEKNQYEFIEKQVTKIGYSKSWSD